MSEFKTEEDFAANLNTMFRVNVVAPRPIELKLIQVKRHLSAPTDEPGMERFSIFFTGPADIMLPQGTYPVVNDNLGEFDLFLVPIKQEPAGVRYEAVFNFYKTATATGD
jgi:hypothetical protein